MNSFLHTLVVILIFTGTARAQYAIDWFTIDGGGGTSSGGAYTLSGTIGQSDAGALRGSGYTLEGGFWPGFIVPETGGAPALFVQLVGNSIIISWSPATSGFSLEQTDNLSSPSWSAAPTGNPSAPIPAASGTRFFRLKKP